VARRDRPDSPEPPEKTENPELEESLELREIQVLSEREVQWERRVNEDSSDRREKRVSLDHVDLLELPWTRPDPRVSEEDPGLKENQDKPVHEVCQETKDRREKQESDRSRGRREYPDKLALWEFKERKENEDHQDGPVHLVQTAHEVSRDLRDQRVLWVSQ